MDDVVTAPPEGDATDSGSRRHLLKLAGAAAGGAAIAAVAASAPHASASTGEAILGGRRNSAINMTYLNNGATANGAATSPLTTEPTMMWVDNRASVIDGNGLRGDGHGKGSGLWGVNDNGTDGAGVTASAALGTGLVSQGALGAVQLIASGPAPTTRPAPFVGKARTLETDTDGNLWFCIAASSPAAPAGKWVKLAGPAAAGAFHPISPARVYDSRGNMGATASGAITQTQNRVIPVGDARNLDGTIATPNVVPPGATAMTFNLTVTGTTGAFGYLSMVPGDAASATTSTINWDGPGKSIANGGTVKLDGNRQVKVFCSDPVAVSSTQFILDVTGYYL